MKIKFSFYLVIFLLLGISYGKLASQSAFSVDQIDASNFPIIKMGFVALDSARKPYGDLIPTDFDLKENGISMNDILQLSCQDTLIPPSTSIILICDQSGSMITTDSNGISRWQMVIDAASAFIKNIKFIYGTQIAIITFGNVSYIRCPFTQNKQELIDSLNNTHIGGGTNYNAPILDPQQGAIYLFNTYSPDINKRRIIVFITDGDPDAVNKTLTDSLIKSLNSNYIQFNAVTLDMLMNPDLSKIATATGGCSYEVYTKEQLDDVFQILLYKFRANKYAAYIGLHLTAVRMFRETERLTLHSNDSRLM